MARFAQRRDEIWADERRPGESAAGSFARRSREAIAASQEMRRDLAPPEPQAADPSSRSSEIGQELGSFLPPLATRLERLAQMGAHLSADPTASVARYRPGRGMTALAWVIGVPLVALLAVLFLLLFLCLAALIGMALLFELALVLPVVYLSHGLLRA